MKVESEIKNEQLCFGYLLHVTWKVKKKVECKMLTKLWHGKVHPEFVLNSESESDTLMKAFWLRYFPPFLEKLKPEMRNTKWATWSSTSDHHKVLVVEQVKQPWHETTHFCSLRKRSKAKCVTNSSPSKISGLNWRGIALWTRWKVFRAFLGRFGEWECWGEET